MLKYMCTKYSKFDNLDWVLITFITHFDFIFQKEIHYKNKDKLFVELFDNTKENSISPIDFQFTDKSKLIIKQFYEGESFENYEGYKQDISYELKEILNNIF